MSDLMSHSFKILKQTIPLLLKHEVPAIPTNYALWYTYVDHQNDPLNEEIEQALANGRPFSDIYTKELYRKHVADKEELTAFQLRQSVEAMLTEFSQTVVDTKSDTEGFKDTMDTCLDDLDKVEKEGWSMDEVMQLLRSLVKDTQMIRNSTLDFVSALNTAEREVAVLRKELEQTQRDAFYDALTNLYNRRYLNEEIKTIQPDQHVCLMMIDVDHFKDINDQYGHQMGDRVLKAVAKRIHDKCRQNAIAFRFGGEEFAVLIRNSKMSEAIHQAEIIRQALEKVSVFDRRRNKTIAGITASFGVSCYEKGMQRSDLLEKADKQLYEAKRLGRNRVMPMRT